MITYMSIENNLVRYRGTDLKKCSPGKQAVEKKGQLKVNNRSN